MTLQTAIALLGVQPSDDLTIIKSRYHKLALSCHPDRPNGSEEAMKRLNEAYEFLRANFGNLTNAERDHIKFEINPEILAKAVRIKNMNETLDVSIAGAWIWVQGETLKEHKDQREILKSEGFKFSRDKLAWFFAGCKSYSRKKTPLHAIFDAYGKTSIDAQYSNRLSA